MPTIMRIAGWKAEGLRCPDHELSFLTPDGKVNPITLIQMPNGTGKTTTLELLRAALSGSATQDPWDPVRVRSFRKRGDSRKDGLFRVILLHNQHRITLSLALNFEDGTMRYTTTVPSGMKQGFHPPRDLANFLRPEFVNFFVFDGELAEQLLSHKHTNAQSVIEDLFQLNLFGTVANRVREYWEHQTSHRGATEDRGLSRRRNRVATLRSCIARLEAEQAELQTRRDDASKDLQNKKRRFQAALTAQKELGERLRKSEADLVAASAAVNSAAKGLLASMRNPHALSAVFAVEMVTLKGSLDRAKLPESTAREFFEELAEESHCVCGRELDDDTRRIIRERASLYLGSDDVALLNAIKGDVADIVGSTPESHEANLKIQVKGLTDCTRKENEMRTARDQIETEGVANDPTLEDAQRNIAQLEQKLRSLDDELQKYDDMSEAAGDDDTYGIKVLKRRLSDAEDKLAEISQTLALKGKRDILVQILESAQSRARVGISREICAEANERIESLMPHNAIRIREVNRCLLLQNQEGGSVGETLSVAYAFLATLFKRTDHELPFVVDSPANPIDLQVRSKVAELIPRLTDQFLAFTISSEREGFLKNLEQAAPEPLQYITLFRKGAGDLDEEARTQPEVQDSLDGLCVFGRPFFHEFHIDREAGNAV